MKYKHKYFGTNTTFLNMNVKLSTCSRARDLNLNLGNNLNQYTKYQDIWLNTFWEIFLNIFTSCVIQRDIAQE